MKKFNTETAALYLLSYIDNINTESVYDKTAKKWAKHYIHYLSNYHIKQAESNFKRNTEHNGQK